MNKPSANFNPYGVQASYNQQINRALYNVCGQLTDAQLNEDRGAFFGSILLTLNHIMIVDTYWFYQCSKDKAQVALADWQGNWVSAKTHKPMLTQDFTLLTKWRKELDERIVAYINGLTPAVLESRLPSRAATGEPVEYPFQHILMHWFNHQVHHRGQVTTLLSQMGVDYGDTDLLMFDV